MDRATKPELSKSFVLAELFTSDEISEVLLKIKPDYIREDLRQHVFLILFEREDSFIIDLYERKKLRQFVVKTLYNTANFSESKFNRELRRRTEIPTESFEGEGMEERRDHNTNKISSHILSHADDEQESYDYEALVEACPVKLEAIYWYNRDMLRLYVEQGSYRAVAKATGIPVNSVYHAVKQAREEMKKLLWE